MANQNILTYKKLHKYLIDGKLFTGVSIRSGDTEFIVPDDYKLSGFKTRTDKQGNRYVSVTSIRWFTNIDHGLHPQPMKLHSEQWNLHHNERLRQTLLKKYNSTKYIKYRNANAIEVPVSECIPSRHGKIYGVPISFLDKMCPEQFSIVGVRKGADGKDLCINGVTPYCRLLICRKGDENICQL